MKEDRKYEPTLKQLMPNIRLMEKRIRLLANLEQSVPLYGVPVRVPSLYRVRNP